MYSTVAALALAAMVVQEAGIKPSAFDTPMGELTGQKGDSPLDRLSLNQMMRLSALPPQRMREFQCAGVANWKGSAAWPVFALSDDQRTTFIDKVAAAFANDIEVEKDLARDLLDAYAMEPPYQEKQGKLKAWRAQVEKDCRDLMAQLRAGTYQLAPLAQPSVVNATLASCYGRYIAAAERTKDKEEAISLRATAAKAEAIALDGKDGDALAVAKAALAQMAEDSRKVAPAGEDAETMQLVMCLPAIEAAKLEQAKK